MSRSTLLNFSKGEVGPQLYSRIDAGQYAASLKQARNVIVQRYGGAATRPGTRVIGELAQQDQPARLVPFQYSIDQAYVLAFQQAIAQPTAFGGFLLEPDDLKVESATQANPVVLTISFHGLVAGDRIYLRGLTGMPQLQGRTVRVTAVVDENNVAINVDGTSFAALTGSTGTIRTTSPPAPTPTTPPSPTPMPPPPPETGGGGGTGGGLCVADDTLILLADGNEIPAARLRVGTMLWTRHDDTKEWGEFAVLALTFAEQPVMKWNDFRATPDHRLWVGERWQTMRELGGVDDGTARVARISVQGARTYVSNGLLSHNLKPDKIDNETV